MAAAHRSLTIETKRKQVDAQSSKTPRQRVESVFSEEPEGGASGVSQGPLFFFISPPSPSKEDDSNDPSKLVTICIEPSSDIATEISWMAIPNPKLYGGSHLVNLLRRPQPQGGGHYLLLQKGCRPSAPIHIVDPSTWISRGLLMGCDPLSHDVCYGLDPIWSILKVVPWKDSIVPGTPVVGMARPHRHLVFTMVGRQRPWRSLGNYLGVNFQRYFCDVIWRPRDGLFWALPMGGDMACTFDFFYASSGRKFMEAQEFTLGLTPGFNYDAKEFEGCDMFLNALFVDAPSGLFIVRWEKATKKGEEVRKQLHVHKLMVNNGGAEKIWERVTSLDGYSFFMGSNDSVALSAADFPGLRPNRIYLPLNGRYPIHDALSELYDFIEDPPVNWIYNLEDESWQQFNALEAASMAPPFDRCPLQFTWVSPPYDLHPSFLSRKFPSMIGEVIPLTPKDARSLPALAHEGPEISSSADPMLKADSSP